MFLSFNDSHITLKKGDVVSLHTERELVRLFRNDKPIYFNQPKRKRYMISAAHISDPTFEGFIEFVALTHGFKIEKIIPPKGERAAYRFV